MITLALVECEAGCGRTRVDRYLINGIEWFLCSVHAPDKDEDDGQGTDQ